jgi:beta-galactosidase GanA
MVETEVKRAAGSILVVGESTDPCKILADETGRETTVSANVPDDLSSFSAIVILKDSVCNKELADKLRDFVQDGGGVVLLGSEPSLLCDDPNANDLSPIADWFGASKRTIWQVQDNELVTTVRHGVGSHIGEKSGLFKPVGEWDNIAGYEYRSLGERATAIAIFKSKTNDSKLVEVFSNEYGKGKIYYQAFANQPGCKKLDDLFTAGCKWAATPSG